MMQVIEELQKVRARREIREKRYTESKTRDRERVIELMRHGLREGRSMSAMSRAAGVSRKTAYHWLGLQEEDED